MAVFLAVSAASKLTATLLAAIALSAAVSAAS
jgi:hypothetical protein